MDTRAIVKERLIAELQLEDIRPEDIDDTAPLFRDGLGLDSLDAVELVVLVKRNFGITIEDADEARRVFYSVATMADYIDARLAEHAAS